MFGQDPIVKTNGCMLILKCHEEFDKYSTKVLKTFTFHKKFYKSSTEFPQKLGGSYVELLKHFMIILFSKYNISGAHCLKSITCNNIDYQSKN